MKHCGICGASVESTHVCMRPQFSTAGTATMPPLVLNPPPLDLHADCRARLAEVEKERDEALFPSQQRYVTGDLPRLPDPPPTIQLRRETVDEFRAAFGNALRQLSRLTGLAVDDLSPLSVAGKAYEIETMRSRLSAAVETLRQIADVRCRATCGLCAGATARTFLDSLDTTKEG